MAKESVFSKAARAMNRAKYAKYTTEQVSEMNRLAAAKRNRTLTAEEVAERMKIVRAGKSPGPFHPKG